MHKNLPSGKAKIKLMTLSNVKLYPNQVMHSWFLTRISKTNESADGSHKQLQETEKFLLNSHFVTADLWFGN